MKLTCKLSYREEMAAMISVRLTEPLNTSFQKRQACPMK